ncbi:hypothetical protein SBA2_660006 [Acidobacteriia bacterium SbA2]|nr:hypothetical protein SBA2_660006 [Acidobacteriia bacterium SbA2]
MVAFEGRHFILTATHVWAALRRSRSSIIYYSAGTPFRNYDPPNGLLNAHYSSGEDVGGMHPWGRHASGSRPG